MMRLVAGAHAHLKRRAAGRRWRFWLLVGDFGRRENEAPRVVLVKGIESDDVAERKGDAGNSLARLRSQRS
jgi:hypothetical protein